MKQDIDPWEVEEVILFPPLKDLVPFLNSKRVWLLCDLALPLQVKRLLGLKLLVIALRVGIERPERA
jgi:hypothetical protein